MARARWLKPEFFTDAKTREISNEALLVFAAIWVEADDGGVAPGDARILFGRRFIHRERWGWSEETVELSLDELAGAGLLVRFRFREERYVWIPEFAKKQGIRPRDWRHLGTEHPAIIDQVAAGLMPRSDETRQQVAVAPSQRRYFYVLEATGAGLVKFGTTDDPRTRIQGLQGASPVPLAIVAVVESTTMDEAQAKRTWSHYRAKGNEWFSAADDLLAWARQLQETHGITPFERKSNGDGTAAEPAFTPKPLARAEAIATTSAVAVPKTASAQRAWDELGIGIPEPYHEALVGILQANRNPDAAICAIRALGPGGVHERYTWDVLGRALFELAAVGGEFTPRRLDVFARTVVADQRAPAVGETPGDQARRRAAELERAERGAA